MNNSNAYGRQATKVRSDCGRFLHGHVPLCRVALSGQVDRRRGGSGGAVARLEVPGRSPRRCGGKQWLLTIVRRENARYFERRRLETVDIDNLTASQSALLAEAPTEELNDLREAIYRLEDDYREPLVLQVLMGYSTNEIAELMGLKQGAVLTRLHRARLKLKEEAADEVNS